MVKLLFCLELFKYSMFDSARYHIVDSIDAAARTIVAARLNSHINNLAGLTKEDLCHSGRSLFV